MRTRSHHVCFFSVQGVDYPISYRVDVSETFRTSRFNNYENSIFFKSLPKSFDHKLPRFRTGNLLEDITENNQVKFTTFSSGNHSE
jgi:hypothetical protein